MAKQFMQASNKFYFNKTEKLNEPTHFYEHIFVIISFFYLNGINALNISLWSLKILWERRTDSILTP